MSGQPMSVFKAIHDYITKIVSGVGGMKSLLLDTETSGIVGVVYSQSEILARQVYLTEQLDAIAHRLNPSTPNNKAGDLAIQSFTHLKAVVIAQPTPATLRALQLFLATHRYPSYHLFFTNMLPPTFLDKLAQADIHDYVKEVHEYYLDYYAITPVLFHLNNTHRTAGSRYERTYSDVNAAMFDRDVSGILAACLSLKRRPEIRYTSSSDKARTVALQVSDTMAGESELFNFTNATENSPQTLLLILDRRDDPVTPLLTQWTYQSMVHELLTLHNNRLVGNKSIITDETPQIPSSSAIKNKTDTQTPKNELKEFILSPQTDEFFRKNMFCNFGEMGMRIKKLVSDYQLETKTNAKIESIEDLQNFVNKFPEYRQMSGNVSKHVKIMTELSSIVTKRSLMKLSAVEQEIVCGNSNEHDSLVQNINNVLNDPNPNMEFQDKLRIVCLYALRYEKHDQSSLRSFRARINMLAMLPHQKEQTALIDKLIEYTTARARKQDLFGDNILKNFIQFVKTGINGVDNIYTQHKPVLTTTLTRLFTGDLSLKDFPYVDGHGHAKIKFKNVIVFMIGGVTYEEYAAVENLLHSKDRESTSPTNVTSASVNSSGGNSSLSVTSSVDKSQSLREPASPNPFAQRTSVMGTAIVRGVGNIVGSVGSKVVETAKGVGSSVSLGTFNPREFKVVLGGSAIHNAESFMFEVLPVYDDKLEKALAEQEKR